MELGAVVIGRATGGAPQAEGGATARQGCAVSVWIWQGVLGVGTRGLEGRGGQGRLEPGPGTALAGARSLWEDLIGDIMIKFSF